MKEALTSFLLESGLDIGCDQETLGEIVFLARQMPTALSCMIADMPAWKPSEAPPHGGGETSKSAPKKTPAPNNLTDQHKKKKPPESSTVVEAEDDSPQVAIYPYHSVEGGPKKGTPFRAPSTSALPDALRLGRALKPLTGAISSNGIMVFDEQATAEEFAQTGVINPRYRLEGKRWLEAAVILDDTHETVIWRESLTEFAHLLQLHGAFRDVRTWRLNCQGRLIRGLAPSADELYAHPRALVDPRGRRLILLATTGRGASWQNGAIQSFCGDILPTNPTALLHLLPSRLWYLSATGYPTCWLQSLQGVAKNMELCVTRPPDPLGLKRTQEAPKGTSLPVVTLSPISLKAYARMVVGAESRVPGIELEKLGGTPAIKPKQPQTGAERVREFGTWASVEAYRLVHHLATVPLMLPVIRIIHRAIIEEPSVSAIGEILASGLVTALDYDGEFEFVEGVMEALYEGLPRSATQQAQLAVSSYIREQFGIRTDYDLVAEDTRGAVGISEEAKRFLQASLRIRRMLGLGSSQSPVATSRVFIIAAQGLRAESQTARRALDSLPGVTAIDASEKDLAEMDRWETAVFIFGPDKNESCWEAYVAALSKGVHCLAFLNRYEQDINPLSWPEEHWLYRDPGDIEKELKVRLRDLANPKGYAALISVGKAGADVFELTRLYRRFGFRVDLLQNPGPEEVRKSLQNARAIALKVPTIFAFQGEVSQKEDSLLLRVRNEDISVTDPALPWNDDEHILLVIDAKNSGERINEFSRPMPPTLLSWAREGRGVVRQHTAFTWLAAILRTGYALTTSPVLTKEALFEFMWRTAPKDLRVYGSDKRKLLDYSPAIPALALSDRERIVWSGSVSMQTRLEALGMRLHQSAGRDTEYVQLSDGEKAPLTTEPAIVSRCIDKIELPPFAVQPPLLRSDDIVGLFCRVRSAFDTFRDKKGILDGFTLPVSKARCISWAPDGEELYVAAESGWARWRPGQPMQWIPATTGEITSVAAGLVHVVLGTSTSLEFVDRNSGLVQTSRDNPMAGGVEDMAVDGSLLLAWNRSGYWCYQRVNDDDHQLLRTRKIAQSSLALHRADQPLVATGHFSGIVRVDPLDSKTGDGIAVGQHLGTVNAVAISPDGHFLASGSSDGTVAISYLGDPGKTSVFLSHRDQVVSIAFSSDSSLMATLALGGQVRIWSADGWRHIATLEKEAGNYYGDLAFQPGTHQLAIAPGGGSRVDLHNVDRLPAINLEKPSHYGLYAEDNQRDEDLAREWRRQVAISGCRLDPILPGADLANYEGIVILRSMEGMTSTTRDVILQARKRHAQDQGFRVVVALRDHDSDAATELEDLIHLPVPYPAKAAEFVPRLLECLKGDMPKRTRRVFVNGSTSTNPKQLAEATRVLSGFPYIQVVENLGETRSFVESQIRSSDMALFVVSPQVDTRAIKEDFDFAQRAGVPCALFFTNEPSESLSSRFATSSRWRKFILPLRAQADYVQTFTTLRELRKGLRTWARRIEEFALAPRQALRPVSSLKFIIYSTPDISADTLKATEHLALALERAGGMGVRLQPPSEPHLLTDATYIDQAQSELKRVIDEADDDDLILIAVLAPQTLRGVDQSLANRLAQPFRGRPELRVIACLPWQELDGVEWLESPTTPWLCAVGIPWSESRGFGDHPVYSLIQALECLSDGDRSLRSLGQAFLDWANAAHWHRPHKPWFKPQALSRLQLPPPLESRRVQSILWVCIPESYDTASVMALRETGSVVTVTDMLSNLRGFMASHTFDAIVVESTVSNGEFRAALDIFDKTPVLCWSPGSAFTPPAPVPVLNSLSELLEHLKAPGNAPSSQAPRRIIIWAEPTKRTELPEAAMLLAAIGYEIRLVADVAPFNVATTQFLEALANSAEGDTVLAYLYDGGQMARQYAPLYRPRWLTNDVKKRGGLIIDSQDVGLMRELFSTLGLEMSVSTVGDTSVAPAECICNLLQTEDRTPLTLSHLDSFVTQPDLPDSLVIATGKDLGFLRGRRESSDMPLGSILWVTDAPEKYEYESGYLEGAGLVVTTATTRDADYILMEQEFHLVISDVKRHQATDAWTYLVEPCAQSGAPLVVFEPEDSPSLRRAEDAAEVWATASEITELAAIVRSNLTLKANANSSYFALLLDQWRSEPWPAELARTLQYLGYQVRSFAPDASVESILRAARSFASLANTPKARIFVYVGSGIEDKPGSRGLTLEELAAALECPAKRMLLFREPDASDCEALSARLKQLQGFSWAIDTEPEPYTARLTDAIFTFENDLGRNGFDPIQDIEPPADFSSGHFQLATSYDLGFLAGQYAGPSRLKHKKLIWITEYPGNYEFMFGFANAQGLRISVCKTNKEVFELLGRSEYDLIINSEVSRKESIGALDAFDGNVPPVVLYSPLGLIPQPNALVAHSWSELKAFLASPDPSIEEAAAKSEQDAPTLSEKQEWQLVLSNFSSAEEAIAQGAFERLVSVSRPYLQNRLAKNGLNPEDTEDVIQLVCSRIWQIRHTVQFESLSKWFAYLYKAATHRALDLLRSSARAYRQTFPEAEDSTFQSVSSLIDQESLFKLADEHWLGIPRDMSQPDRELRIEALRLHILEGLPASEVAKRGRGLSPETIEEWASDPSTLKLFAYEFLYHDRERRIKLIHAPGSHLTEQDQDTIIQLYFGIGMVANSIASACSLPQSAVREFIDRCMESFSMEGVAREFREKLSEAQAAIIARSQNGLWRRLVFQYHFMDELPQSLILWLGSPVAGVFNYNLTAGTLTAWTSGQRLLRDFSKTLKTISSDV